MDEPQRANWWETPEEALEREELELCDHLLEYGRDRKFDGGRCSLLCSRCRVVLGYWGVAEGGTLADGPYQYTEWLCVDPDHPGCRNGDRIDYIWEREASEEQTGGLW